MATEIYVKIYNDENNVICVESRNVNMETLKKCVEYFKKCVNDFECTDLILELTFE